LLNFKNIFIPLYASLTCARNTNIYNQSILEGLIRAMPQITERNQLM